MTNLTLRPFSKIALSCVLIALCHAGYGCGGASPSDSDPSIDPSAAGAANTEYASDKPSSPKSDPKSESESNPESESESESDEPEAADPSYPPPSTPTPDPTPDKTAPVASSLTGVWVGKVSSSSDSYDARCTFNQAGNLMLEYKNSSGELRQTELGFVGQQVRWVPPGGGVKTLVVAGLAKAPGQLSLSLQTSFEKTSDGYFTQNSSRELLEFARTAQGVAMRSTRPDSGQIYQGLLSAL